MTDLIPQIEDVVLATPGVLGLYRTGSVVRNAVGAAVEALAGAVDRTGAAETPRRIVVGRDGDDLTVDIAIGIAADAGAVATTQTVRDAVTGLLAAWGEHTARLRITVVRIADGAPATAGAPRSLA